MTRFAWFGYILYGFARLIGLLPMAVLRALGAAFGGLAYRLDSRETRIARRNLALIHPEIDETAREMMTRELMRSMGQGLMETLAIWTRPRARVLRLVQRVHGETHLQTALAQGRGVLLAVPHYGNWELLIEFMAARGPFSLVYKASEKAGLECFLQKARNGTNVQLVPAEATAMRPLHHSAGRASAVAWRWLRPAPAAHSRRCGLSAESFPGRLSPRLCRPG